MRTTTKRWRRTVGVASAIGVLSLVVWSTAAGAAPNKPATSGTVPMNVGLSKPVKVKMPMKIGIFTSAGTAAFGQAEDASMKAYASKHDMTLTFFTAAFKSTLQFNQLQTAIQDKKYNVLGVLPVDGQTICKELSVNAPKAGLLVTDFDQPLCGRYVHEGVKLWQPGTLNYISGYDTKTTLRQWINAIIKANPGNQTVGLVEGDPSDGLSTNINTLIAKAEKKHPNFHVVATVHTTYTSEQGYTETQDLLQAHPGLSVVIADQSTITEGAARAVSQAGDSKKVFVADYGGDKAIVTLIKQGEVQLTTPTWPATEGRVVLKQLILASHGKKVKRFISLPFKVVTPTNVSSYKAEY